MMFKGEAEDIATVKALGAKWGYGNLIHHLRNAWSESLQRNYGFEQQTADYGAGHICVWCRTDSRTGRKVPKSKAAKPPSP